MVRPRRAWAILAEGQGERCAGDASDWGTRAPSMLPRRPGSTRKIDDTLGRHIMLLWSRMKDWLRDSKSARRAVRRQCPCQLRLEVLEDRTVPSTITAASGIAFSTTSLACTGVGVATFNVQGAGEPAANFSATIDWGDQ